MLRHVSQGLRCDHHQSIRQATSMTGELPIDLPVERSPSPDGLEPNSLELGVESKGTLACLGSESDDASWIHDSWAAASHTYPGFQPRHHTLAAAYTCEGHE